MSKPHKPTTLDPRPEYAYLHSHKTPQILDWVEILHGESLSNASIDLNGAIITGLVLDGWTSADITFQSAVDGKTFKPLLNGDGEITIADPSGVAGGDVEVNIEAARVANVRHVKVQSGTNATPVEQTPGEGQVRRIGIVGRSGA